MLRCIMLPFTQAWEIAQAEKEAMALHLEAIALHLEAAALWWETWGSLISKEIYTLDHQAAHLEEDEDH